MNQEKNGSEYHLRGNAEVETADMILKADEIDYDADTGEAEARGNVRFEHFVRGEKLQASRVEYNTDSELGKFYDVSGTSPAKIEARPGILTTPNPFYFQGKWAEKVEDRYILHDGFVTDCKYPGGWWVLRGPKFDIIPGERALVYKSVFWLKRTPIFYMPVMYKSLKRMPRKSGFLTPNIGNSSRRGKMLGWGYFWAINRSYDVMYRQQYFTERGFAHTVDIRGKINQHTDFDALIYGVNDKGIMLGNTLVKQGGFLSYVNAKSDLGHGWEARGQLNYLSSFTFRQNFTESFFEAVNSETQSTGYITKHWSSYGVYGVLDYNQLFLSTDPNQVVSIRKLPEGDFLMRERPLTSAESPLPIYVSMVSSAGLVRRDEPNFATRQFVDRLDVEPTVTTAFSFKGFRLMPSFGLREARWGSSVNTGEILSGADVTRNARQFTADLVFPSLERIFAAPKWSKNVKKVKHVIEARATYIDIGGVEDFNRIIRIDEMETLANTREVDFSVTNRFYTKNAQGGVTEALSWQLIYARYFKPDFGGAVLPGQRNVVYTAAELTGYAFLDQPRSYSPVVSILRLQSRVGLEWRADYDPLRGHIVDSSINADWRKDKYFLSVGHNQVRNVPEVLAPNSNQINGRAGLGNENRRGWNAGFQAFYDYRKQIMQFATTQVTYNTDCCGFSVQYRRFAFGTRYENQFRVAFAIANVGNFGTLKRQDRMF